MQAMLCSESFRCHWGLTLQLSEAEEEEEEERERLRIYSSHQGWSVGCRYSQAAGKLVAAGAAVPVH